MIHRAAEINQDGQKALLELGGLPVALDCDPTILITGAYRVANQAYIPGISVPGVPGLEKPFLVPLIGDNESFGLTVDWPQKREAPYYKRIVFTGILPAEDVYFQKPTTTKDGDDSDYERDPELHEAFDDFIDDGAFFRAEVRLVYDALMRRLIPHGQADFYLFEDVSEWEDVERIIEQGIASMSEIVAALRVPKLGSFVCSKELSEEPALFVKLDS